jgi:hypothetical protein
MFRIPAFVRRRSSSKFSNPEGQPQGSVSAVPPGVSRRDERKSNQVSAIANGGVPEVLSLKLVPKGRAA